MEIRHDLHMHTTLSHCGKEGATPENYLQIAKEKGLSVIGFCDHVWDTAVSPAINSFYEGQDAERILSAPLPKADGVRILRGCEAELDKNGVLGLSEDTAKKFDYILCTHSHSQHPEVIDAGARKDPKKLADILCERFSVLVEHPMSKYITAIAHPFFPSGNRENFDEVLFRIADDRLEDLFADAVYKNVALELNAAAFAGYPVKSIHRSEMFRIYETAKEAGCKFVFGTDCHDPKTYNERFAYLTALCELLEITDEDLCPLVK